MKTVLTIAGSDCSGGAGIQADLKTMGAFGVYGMSVITAITVQNTKGVSRVVPVEAEIVGEQLRAVCEDIFPDAIKIGMMATEANIQVVARILKECREGGRRAPFVVVDPVLVSTSGKDLLDKSAWDVLTGELFPAADLITPNLPEACRLGECSVSSDREREEAAKKLCTRYGCSVLIKGGHSGGRADDLLSIYPSGETVWYGGEMIESRNTHGTGCTLSSAIACGMALGNSLESAVKNAKQYITGAIEDGMDLGEGNGPLNHFYRCG